MLQYLPSLFREPQSVWDAVRDEHISLREVYVPYLLLMAAIPAVCIFIGAAQIGWTIGNGDPTRLTVFSALVICAGTYGALLVGTYLLGYAIHWMAGTYGVSPKLDTCVALAALFLTPMMVAGVIAIYPSLWVYMLAFLAALAYSVYLLYAGLPAVLQIPEEKGFVYASAVLTMGLVFFVGLLALTAVAWSVGLGPVYVR